MDGLLLFYSRRFSPTQTVSFVVSSLHRNLPALCSPYEIMARYAVYCTSRYYATVLTVYDISFRELYLINCHLSHCSSFYSSLIASTNPTRMQHNTTGHIPDADTLLGGESLGLPLVIGMLLDCVLTLILIVFMCVFLFLYPSAAATATFPDERPLGPSQVKYRTCTDSKDYQQVSCFNHLSLHARQGYCYFSFIFVHLHTQLFFYFFPFQQKKK